MAIPIPNSLADKLCSTDQTTSKPPNPTTAEPINPTTIADPTDPTDPCINLNVWIGDGECDDATNNAECGYDGGDCCGDDVKTDYCNECICYQT